MNLNDYCTVLLSEVGAAHLNQINDLANKTYLSGCYFKLKSNYNTNSEFTSPLWHLFELFGGKFSLGSESMFVDSEIKVKQVKQASKAIVKGKQK